MEGILEFKGKLQKLYANYSKYIDKAVRFVLAFTAFFMINREVGYMHILASPAAALGLGVVCAFLPPVCTLLAAAVLVLAHVYTVSLGMVIVLFALFFVMYVFYLRFAPKTAITVLIMVAAHIAKVPAAALVAFGLLGTPVYAVPAALGTVAYYGIHQAKKMAAAIQASEEGSFLNEMLGFAGKALSGKEMWLMVVIGIVCVVLVYNIRRSAVKYAWRIAGIAGAVWCAVVTVAGGAVLGIKGSAATALIGALAAVVTAVVLEVLFFAVDYSRSETLQFEDDEYFYYVKAVPKVGVAASEKTVKQINKRAPQSAGAEVVAARELREKVRKPAAAKKKLSAVDTDKLLLTQSMERELNLQKERGEARKAREKRENPEMRRAKERRETPEARRERRRPEAPDVRKPKEKREASEILSQKVKPEAPSSKKPKEERDDLEVRNRKESREIPEVKEVVKEKAAENPQAQENRDQTIVLEVGKKPEIKESPVSPETQENTEA